MAFAIELYFDSVADSLIRDAWAALSAASLPTWPRRIGARPHVSILVIDAASTQGIDALFRSIQPLPFQINFTIADYFEGNDAILFLKPDASEELVELHARATETAQSLGLTPRHDGDEWVPHCTCDYGVSPKQLPVGLSILRQFLPVQARIQEIGYVEVTPEFVHQISTVTIDAASHS